MGNLDIKQCLKDAGCTAQMIEEYGANPSRQQSILILQRRMLLERIHTNQKKLDCLDYLLYLRKKDGLDH